MILWKRAALLGFLSWMIPFAISFLLFPLKKPNAPLFGTLMGLVVLLTAAALLNCYFRDRAVSVSEARVWARCGWRDDEAIHRTGLSRAHRPNARVHPAASG